MPIKCAVVFTTDAVATGTKMDGVAEKTEGNYSPFILARHLWDL